MDETRQIEEMADTMCGSHGDYCKRDGFPCEQGCRNGYLQAARRMYYAGYRKQREGKVIETIKNGRSNRVFDCCGEDFTKLTSWIIPKYCPNCGAKMKGGAK